MNWREKRKEDYFKTHRIFMSFKKEKTFECLSLKEEKKANLLFKYIDIRCNMFNSGDHEYMDDFTFNKTFPEIDNEKRNRA